MHLCTLFLACCALLFAQGYAALLPEQNYTFKPVIYPRERGGPKDYQDMLLKAINKLSPDGYKPMKYNHKLERDAIEICYKPYKEELKRFDALLTISEEAFYSNPEKAFETALSAVPDKVTSMWYLSSSYQIGCHVNLIRKERVLHILCMFD